MDLLDILARETGCTFLSDLKSLPRPNRKLQSAVVRLPFDCFSDHDWLDAADYLCGVKCQSAEEARNALLSF